MAERFHGFSAAATGADVCMLNLFGASTIRPHLFDFTLGSSAAPADVAVQFGLRRTTAVGTETAGFTPVLIDPDGPVSLSDCGADWSTDPTDTANSELWVGSINQRATYRWVASPRGELKIPATASNGIAMWSIAVSSGVTIWETSFHWEE